jgi:hypothetical protein
VYVCLCVRVFVCTCVCVYVCLCVKHQLQIMFRCSGFGSRV